MPDELSTRTTPADLELRGSDGRTVAGICVPFDSPAAIGNHFEETIKPGAFARTINERGAERVKFFVDHGHRRGQAPIGRASVLREDARGLYGEFRVSKTTAGDEALELIRDGALDAFSIGFHATRDSWSNGNRSRAVHEAALREVSACAFPAYADAVIEAVRSADEPAFLLRTQAEELLARLTPKPISVVTAWRQFLDLKESHR